MRRGLAWAALVPLALAACDPEPAPPLPPGSFAFAVFGDGPYYAWEQGRWRRVLADLARSDIEWLVHVGDLYWRPCSDEMNALRVSELDALPHPVVYTPGDNEWTDCHGRQEGGRDPLERLAALRRAFYPDPASTLGTPAMAVESQSADPAFAEYVENVRWRRGGFWFATVHAVGSTNAREPFPGRTAASDAESLRRTEAALAWLRGTFAAARADAASGVVIAWHGEMGLAGEEGLGGGYEAFRAGLEREVAAFSGSVLVIHGDSHLQRVDHPLVDSLGRSYPNFTRLETYGAPDIGWVRVVVDSVAGRITEYQPRRMRGSW